MNLTINGNSISAYGATLLSAKYGYSKVTNYNDWLRGAKNPLYFGQDVTYTEANYLFLVEAANLNELDTNCSNLCNAMKKAIVKETESDWFVDGHIISITETNRISPTAREIEITFEGIKIADRQTLNLEMSFETELEFKIKGNQTVPCHIEVVPDMGYAQFDMTLNGQLFRINNISSSSLSLVLDSENGVITLDGENKIEDYEPWEMPYVKGGTNTLKINGSPTVKISYNGRWM